MEKFRDQAAALTPQIVAEIDEAWRMYLRTQLGKALVEDVQISEGSETVAWAQVLERSKDSAWKAEALKRDEKFDMHLKALVSTHSWMRRRSQVWANERIVLIGSDENR